MRRACRSMPPYALCCLVENRLRSPPLEVVEPLTQRQHTTTVCGGGGLKKYQGYGADRFQRPLLRRSGFQRRLKLSVRRQKAPLCNDWIIATSASIAVPLWSRVTSGRSTRRIGETRRSL
jgi:hypothetical protein